MDINQINTVSDLVKQNNVNQGEDEIVATICSAIFEHDPIIGQKVVYELLHALLRYHQVVIDDAVEKGNSTEAGCWSVDLARIDAAINILKTVQL